MSGTRTTTPTAAPTVTTAATQASPTVDTGSTTPTPTGTFSVANGQIVGPSGTSFIARGINVYDNQMSTVSTSSAGNPLISVFPGINMVRLACESYDGASALQAFITTMTSHGIVV